MGYPYGKQISPIRAIKKGFSTGDWKSFPHLIHSACGKLLWKTRWANVPAKVNSAGMTEVTGLTVP